MEEVKEKKLTPEEIEKVSAVLESVKGRKGILVYTFHRIQEELGYLPQEALQMVSERLNISYAQVYGVASFYKHFYFTPRGRNIIKVCVGTACHVRGGKQVLEEVEELLQIKGGETTPDLAFSLDVVGCVGCCALAPVVVVNESVKREMSPTKIRDLIKESIEKEKMRESEDGKNKES